MVFLNEGETVLSKYLIFILLKGGMVQYTVSFHPFLSEYVCYNIGFLAHMPERDGLVIVKKKL